MDIPRELSKNIQLVYNVNPRKMAIVVRGSSNSSTGSSAIFTTSLNNNFFLTAVSLTNQSDATADNTLISFVIIPRGGVATNILRFAKITTTVFQGSITLNLTVPILLDRGSVISFNTSFTVGASNSSASLVGYETDPQ